MKRLTCRHGGRPRKVTKAKLRIAMADRQSRASMASLITVSWRGGSSVVEITALPGAIHQVPQAHKNGFAIGWQPIDS